MTNQALFFMVVVWGIVTLNTLYCFWRLLTSDRDFNAGE
jgi:hypothetical protein